MGVTCFLLLSGLGLAITAQAQDCNKPTAGPNMDLSDRDILLQTFPDGTRATFVCNKGYTPAGGSAFITCTAGTWNPVTLKCERRSCGSAGEVENGDIDYSDGIDFGSKIVITCKTGYILVGKHEIYCGDQGWLDRLPVCEAVACDPPPVVVDGSFTPEKDVYVYREIVQYSCIHGFTVSGSKSVSCSGDGTFKPDPPTCTRVKCQDPVIENADWVEGSRPPYGYKATVTYKCRTGYRMIGERTQICEINNQWSPGLPTCERITSPTTTTTTTTTTTPPLGNGGNPVVTGIVVAVVVIIIFAICGCCGCWIFKKKRGSEKNHADTKAPKSAEEVALSGHERVDQNPADSGCEAGSSLDKPPVMSKNNVC